MRRYTLKALGFALSLLVGGGILLLQHEAMSAHHDGALAKAIQGPLEPIAHISYLVGWSAVGLAIVIIATIIVVYTFALIVLCFAVIPPVNLKRYEQAPQYQPKEL